MMGCEKASFILRPLLVVIAFLIAPGSAFATELPQASHLPESELQPFLQTYCVQCHGPEEQNGQVRFDQVSWTITRNDEAQRWQDVLDVLNGGDMPPEDAKQPESEELARMLDFDRCAAAGTSTSDRSRWRDHNAAAQSARVFGNDPRLVRLRCRLG
jgi:hypothetical protein